MEPMTLVILGLAAAIIILACLLINEFRMHTEDLTSLNATIGRQANRIEALEEMIEFGPQKPKGPVKIMDIKTEALTRTQFSEADTDIIEPKDLDHG